MQKYIKIYLDHFDFKDQSEVMCEVCMKPAAAIYAIGETCDIKNIVALCKKHFEMLGTNSLTNSDMRFIHGYVLCGNRKIFKK